MSDGIESSYEFADTEAANMLRTALQHLKAEGVSLRDVAKRLRYKQPTVLSQMANGRIRIPMKKAGEIAEVTRIPRDAFIVAVANQRQTAAFGLVSALEPGLFSLSPPEGFAQELEAIAGPLDQLSHEQKQVMREVAEHQNPTRRWLTAAELPVIQMLRMLRPNMRERGLSAEERIAIRQALQKHPS